MRTRSGLGFLAAAVLGGGCLQALGYDEPNLVETGTGGGGGIAAHCGNAKKDGDETGVDCGGTCSPCKDGSGCKVAPDCESHVCTGGACLAPACDDKAKNGNETDFDCGGGVCSTCATGKACGKSTDCTSKNCTGGVCGTSCSDGTKNGEETGSDCGGPCNPCKTGDGCAKGIDCESGVCQGVVCVDSFVWAQRFGGTATALTANSIGRSVVVDESGNIVIAGSLGDTADFGGGPLTCAGPADAFVSKFGPTGNHLWSKRVGDAANQAATAAATDPSGNVILTGLFGGTINFGITPHTWSGGFGDAFVTKLDASGNELWTVVPGGSGLEVGNSIAVETGGDILVTGQFTTTIDFLGTKLMSGGGADIFLAKLSPDGPPIWAKSFGDAGVQSGQSVAVDTVGNVFLAATSTTPLNLGGATLPNSGGVDIYIAKFDKDGTHLWSRRFGDAANQSVVSLTVDPSNNVNLVGAFAGVVNFGGNDLVSQGGDDIFVAQFDSVGNHVWSKSFGDKADQSATAVATDKAGNILITGTFEGTFNFGNGPLSSAGGSDVFVAKLDPSGKSLWSRRFGDAQTQQGYGIAAGKNGEIVLTGQFDGILDFGGKSPLLNSGASDIFLAKLLTP